MLVLFEAAQYPFLQLFVASFGMEFEGNLLSFGLVYHIIVQQERNVFIEAIEINYDHVIFKVLEIAQLSFNKPFFLEQLDAIFLAEGVIFVEDCWQL